MTQKKAMYAQSQEAFVKRYLFLPSMKEMWSIVGKEKEYIMLKEPIACSCPSSFFKRLRHKGSCYHESMFRETLDKTSYETIICHDSDIQLVLSMLIENA